MEGGTFSRALRRRNISMAAGPRAGSCVRALARRTQRPVTFPKTGVAVGLQPDLFGSQPADLILHALPARRWTTQFRLSNTAPAPGRRAQNVFLLEPAESSSRVPPCAAAATLGAGTVCRESPEFEFKYNTNNTTQTASISIASVSPTRRGVRGEPTSQSESGTAVALPHRSSFLPGLAAAPRQAAAPAPLGTHAELRVVPFPARRPPARRIPPVISPLS